jgi:thioredoxin 1
MSENITTLTDDNFQTEVFDSELPVLVDFWAPWCGPCVALAPTLEVVANNVAGKAKVGKLNTDENGKTSDMFSIRSIPTLILFKGGKEVSRFTGQRTAAEITAYILNG